jgi:hypothetical protein
MTRSLASLLAFLTLVSAAAAQAPDTTFTYQGRLDLAGQPVTDTGDFQFTLWDAASRGNQIGQLVQVDGVDVANGLFSVQLDFGAPAFGGERWLEISVRTPAGAGAFSTLAPRQAVTASPYSIQTRGFFVDENENVGIGTTTPAGQLALGNYLGGTVGSAIAAYTKQLVLGGEYNASPNVDDSVKLLISDYDNDPPSDIYPIYVEDENNGVDFYLRNSAGLRTAFFGGRVSAPQGFDGPLDASNLTGQIRESELPQNAIDSSEIENNSLTGDDMRGVTSSGAGSKPFHFQRYGPFGNSGILNTGFPTSSYIAVVVGFRTFDGDIQEDGVGDPIYCYAFQQSGAWHVTFDVRSHNTNEGWEVWVMFVDRRMATITGF